jgi:hypothetical protein
MITAIYRSNSNFQTKAQCKQFFLGIPSGGAVTVAVKMVTIFTAWFFLFWLRTIKILA